MPPLDDDQVRTTSALPEVRNTGISAVGRMPWGTHFCHFYETKRDLIDILVPFLKAGLENNEFCMWVSFERTDEQTIEAMSAALPALRDHIDAGDVQFLPYSEWYVLDGRFDLARVIKGWQHKLDQALAKGYDGMRVSGDGGWAMANSLESFEDYERRLNTFIADQRILVLCTYPLAVTGAAELFDVARSHQFAIAKRNGDWEVLETPELRKAKEALKALSEELEQRVAERTNALGRANEELRALSARLHRAREEESARIARELHDELGSALTSLKWEMEDLHGLLAREETDLLAARVKLDAMMSLAEATIVNVRKIAWDLRPSILDDLGLVDAMEWQVDEFRARTGIRGHFESNADESNLNYDQSAGVLRILQEALTNVMRHAQATAVEVTFVEQPEEVVLTITDDGKGVREEAQPAGALGLLGMKERASLFGGSVDIKSGSGGKGTVVTVRLPVSYPKNQFS